MLLLFWFRGYELGFIACGMLPRRLLLSWFRGYKLGLFVCRMFLFILLELLLVVLAHSLNYILDVFFLLLMISLFGRVNNNRYSLIKSQAHFILLLLFLCFLLLPLCLITLLYKPRQSVRNNLNHGSFRALVLFLFPAYNIAEHTREGTNSSALQPKRIPVSGLAPPLALSLSSCSLLTNSRRYPTLTVPLSRSTSSKTLTTFSLLF
jgi:hypothetical protein